MKLDFEYGNGMMSAELPDSTEVFIPGQTVKDPPACRRIGTACMQQRWNLFAARSGCSRCGNWPRREDGRIRHS